MMPDNDKPDINKMWPRAMNDRTPRHHSLPQLILSVLTLLAAVFAYQQLKAFSARQWQQQQPGQQPHQRVFSRDELARYDGTGPDGAIYLAVLGEVYDVTAGAKFYGPSDGAEYRDLVGRDASSAFATGQFSSHAPDVHKVASLSDSDLRAVDDWRLFYQNHKDYRKVGVLYMGDGGEGYYDRHGQPTAELQAVQERVRIIRNAEEQAKAEANKHPGCDSHWEQGKGGEMWCNGGRVPRLGSLSKAMASRCACYDPPFAAKHADLLKVPKNCDPRASRCRIPEN